VIRRYALVSGRIRQELRNLERVVNRIEDGMAAARKRPEDQDFYLDSIALNLHDFYAGLERIFHYIASHLEQSVPTDGEWHRELLRQMNVEVPGVRPTVLSVESVWALDEYLRFRHVVRNVYTFNFDPERIERLVGQIRPCFEQVRSDLLAFASFVERLATDEE
jgi:hypothetical protein